MNKIVHYIGWDIHKETIAVSIAPQNSAEVRRYGGIGGTVDAVDKLIRRLCQPGSPLLQVRRNNREKTATEPCCPLD
jgi:hypothetical protein